MSVIIRIVGTFADGEYVTYNQPTWIEHYDLEANGGRGEVNVTNDRLKALKFPSGAAAMAAWREVPSCRPRLKDGSPNRPLMAMTIQIERFGR